jgi:hypothetical protein
MSALETIVEDLKSLPDDKVDDAAWFVHALVVDSTKARAAMLKRTATALSPEDVDEMEKAIAETCEEVDDHAW